MNAQRKTALTIAGTDCSGGAGVQADLKTMTAHGVYGMSAICALTAQNTTGVAGIFEVSPEFLALQLDCIFTDIFPDAVKTGMVSSTALISVIAEKLNQYKARNLVVDPVMVSTSGSTLLAEDAIDALKQQLLPLAVLATPNIPEAEVLTGQSLQNEKDMELAAREIGKACGCAVLLKGGHRVSDANDYLWEGSTGCWIPGKRVHTHNTHGTGCTLSSAIACNLARGVSLRRAVELAKAYLSGALAAGLQLGAGSGPPDHCFGIGPDFPWEGIQQNGKEITI